jgi:hypothetical protein
MEVEAANSEGSDSPFQPPSREKVNNTQSPLVNRVALRQNWNGDITPVNKQTLNQVNKLLYNNTDLPFLYFFGSSVCKKREYKIDQMK